MPSELICCSPVEFHIGTKVTWWRLSEGHYWYSLALPSNITLTTVDDKDDDEHQYHHHPKTSANDHFGNYWVRKLTQGHRAAAPRCTYVTVELLIHTHCVYLCYNEYEILTKYNLLFSSAFSFLTFCRELKIICNKSRAGPAPDSSPEYRKTRANLSIRSKWEGVKISKASLNVFDWATDVSGLSWLFLRQRWVIAL